MGGNLALREQESAEISEGRRQRLFLVLGRDAEEPAPELVVADVPADEPALRLVKSVAVDAWEPAASEAANESAVWATAEAAGDPVCNADDELYDEEGERDWASRIPDELIVSAAVLGACIGFPIGSAAAGVVMGFLGGLMGALAGAMTVLAIAKHLDLVLRAVLVLLCSAIVYTLAH